MKMNQNTLNQVREYLNKKEVSYLDVYHEILDHLLSDLEYQLANKKSFEEAFSIIKIKWDKLLEPDVSIFLGFIYSKPNNLAKFMSVIILRQICSTSK